MSTMSKSEALSLLASLEVGDIVLLTQDGKEQAVTVQKTLHHADGFGAIYSQQVTVGYGPGRWNRSVSAASLAAGYVDLKPSALQRKEP